MGTTAKKIEPFYSIHPGEILKDEIAYRGITQRDLAAKMGVSYTQLNEILNGKRPVNVEIALLFEAALGLEPVALVNMQTRYNLQTAREDSNLTKRLETIRRICASLA
ncbi:MAG: HigA family addiction module antidote protein [Rikenellaceae bacterium]|jgi:addiction module HigA family antidote|nr:HigA family addiction module antidote protein [Rikenellaceae bacterium]